MDAIRVLIFIVIIILVILLASKFAPVAAAISLPILGGGMALSRTGGGLSFDILESAPLNAPMYIGGRENDSSDLPTLYDGFNKNIRDGAIDKFEKGLSITNIENPDIIIGFHFTNWCIYCKDVKSKWGDVINELRKINSKKDGKKYAVVALNEERHRNLTITTIPTIILYDTANKTTDKYHGKSKPKKILKWILSN